MTDPIPFRTYLAGIVLVVATLAFVVPVQASQCPLFLEWCSCSYCFKNVDCNCRLHEGSPSGTTCEYYLSAGSCGFLQGSADMAEVPETSGDDLTLEQLLAAEEASEAPVPEACR